VTNDFLNIIVNDDNKKIAEWYTTDYSKGFVISFMTSDNTECKAILKIVLEEIEAEKGEK